MESMTALKAAEVDLTVFCLPTLLTSFSSHIYLHSVLVANRHSKRELMVRGCLGPTTSSLAASATPALRRKGSQRVLYVKSLTQTRSFVKNEYVFFRPTLPAVQNTAPHKNNLIHLWLYMEKRLSRNTACFSLSQKYSTTQFMSKGLVPLTQSGS